MSRTHAMLDAYGDLLTVADASAVLQQSAATIRRLCRDGELPSVKIGRRFYIPKSHLVERVEALLARNEVAR